MSTGSHDGGELFCPAECLEGDTAVIFNYARDLPGRIESLRPETEYGTGDVTFHTTPRHRHGMETYGLTFELEGTALSFLPDTDCFPALGDIYADADILVLNVVRHHPVKSGNVQHLCVDDARRVIDAAEPDMAILTHFGMTMVQAGPRSVARDMSDELGIPVEAASDGRTFNL